MNGAGSTDESCGIREIIRLVQCPQCSRPFRIPTRLPCGNTLCRPCLPPGYKRENITYPMIAERNEWFSCPFSEKGKCKDREHSVGDCGTDITLSKILDIFAEAVKKLSI